MFRSAGCVAVVGLAVLACGREQQTKSANAATPDVPTTTEISDVGFSSPETVLWDSVADVYLVSNINGKPDAEDNNGFIARVQPNGTVENLKWIEGGKNSVTLHGPKGLVIKGDTLFAADVGGVRMFDRASGRPLGVRVVATKGLNDLAVGPGGAVFVTDLEPPPSGPMGAPPPAAIYQLTASGVQTVARGNQLEQPDGLLADAQGFIVAPFGASELYRLDQRGAHKQVIAKLPGAKLDGLYPLPSGGWAVTSWDAKTVYSVTPSGVVTPIVPGVDSPAQLGLDRKRGVLLIPSFNGNKVLVIRLSQ